ncbi:PEP-CTERM sorting domain-containing protein [Adhaeretor mobilis]|nr:PEP-CTERM sorting domain-containing protein [Adhaeretor mobilis]
MNKKQFVLAACLLAVANSASAAVNVPSGVTGLWLFSNGSSTQATIGNDVTNVYGNPGTGFTGPAVQIGTESDPFLWQDSGNIQMSDWGAVAVPHGISPNGGGSKVNEYTILMDYRQTHKFGDWVSMFDTYDGDVKSAGNSDGDLFKNTSNQIGTGATGYSTLTYDPSVTHRIVISVDNGSSFQVSVDGVLFLDGTAQPVDGRFSLAPVVHLLVDNAWEAAWGHLETAMIWDHALSPSEAAALGAFSDPGNNNFPTPLVFADPIPEPTSLALIGLGLGSLAGVRRKK